MKSIVVVSPDAGRMSAELDGLGYVVRPALGVREGAQLAEENPDTALVLTGAVFEDGNWRDVMEWIRGRGLNVPVVLCTEVRTAELWWDALECGVLEIVSPASAASVVRRILSGSQDDL